MLLAMVGMILKGANYYWRKWFMKDICKPFYKNRRNPTYILVYNDAETSGNKLANGYFGLTSLAHHIAYQLMAHSLHHNYNTIFVHLFTDHQSPKPHFLPLLLQQE